jgi:hypothetical protein
MIEIPSHSKFWLHFIVYQIGWFCCIYGGKYGKGELGALPMLLYGAWLIYHSQRKLLLLRWAVYSLIGGLLFDCFLIQSNVMHYPVSVQTYILYPLLDYFNLQFLHVYLSPFWVCALWFVWGIYAREQMVTLLKMPTSFMILTAIFGPISHTSGASIGAVLLGGFLQPLSFLYQVQVFLTLSLAWSIHTGILCWLYYHEDHVLDTHPMK